MKFLTALISVILWMGSNVSYAQSIDQTELFSELNAIRTDRSCNAPEAKKLFYFRKGPKSRTSYQVEKDVLSGIQEVFPDQSFFDVSGLGLIAKLDQGSSDQYVDMINASLQAVNEPGLYIHADFSNLEDSEMLEIQAWTIEHVGGSMEQACLKRSILFADQEPDLNSVTDNSGIIIQGGVNNSGSGNVDISNTNFEFDKDASEIRTLEQANLLLTVAPDIKQAAKLIPVKIAYQLTREQLTEIAQHGVSASTSKESESGEITFKDGQYSYAYSDGFLSTERWSLDVQHLKSFRPTSVTNEDASEKTFIDLNTIGVTLGLDDFHAISDKSIKDNESWDEGGIDCWPATSQGDYSDLFSLYCQVENLRIGTIYKFTGRTMEETTNYDFQTALDLMMRSKFIPTSVSMSYLYSPCEGGLWSVKDAASHWGRCTVNPKESLYPISFNQGVQDSELGADFVKHFETMSLYRIFRFLDTKYLLSNSTQDSDSSYHIVNRTDENFRKLYIAGTQVFHADKHLSVDDLIKLKMGPGDRGWDIEYGHPQNIEFVDKNNGRGVIYFSVGQNIRNGCKWFHYDLNFELEISYDVRHIFVLSEKAKRISSKDLSSCK